MKKYNLSDFYVGELFLPIHDYEESYHDIDSNGALDITNIYSMNQNKYKVFFTIFYKMFPNQYICLHDGQKYSGKGECYYNHLIPFSHYMPQYDYHGKTSITFFEGIQLFHSMFCNNTIFSDSNNHYNINQFFVANLNLCTELQIQKGFSQSSFRRVPYNVGQRLLLDSHNASFVGGFFDDEKDRHGGKKYYYEIYRAPFLKVSRKNMYCLDNYHIYSNKFFNRYYEQRNACGRSFYDKMVPFKQELSNHNIKYEQDIIQMKDVLRLERVLKKKYKSGLDELD